MLLRTSRKTQDDEQYDGGLPIPNQIVSNSEFYPIPQTPKQKVIEDLVRDMADERAAALGWSRRRFLQSACGTATALAAINIANGCGNSSSDGGFAVNECATRDPAAAREAFSAEYFIVDVQTHHADLDGALATNPALVDFFKGFRICAPETLANGSCHPGDINELSQANYLKEIFLDSETAVAMMSGIPAPNAATQLISNDSMAATRDVANRVGASQRVITQGMLTPNFPQNADTGTLISDMEHLVRDLDCRALKTYTGAGYGLFGANVKPWWLDDEEVSYPMIEEARRLGLHVVNTHKGLRLGIFDPAPNVYPELGALFAGAVLADNAVERVGHLLGKLVTTFGADHILWGTDSIWYGSPQWQIDALKTFQMPQSMMDEFGYPQITPDIKRRIFGLNAADVYGLDPEELRCTLPNDLLGQAKVAYQDLHDPSLRTYGPRTRREFLQLAFGGRPDPRHRG